MTEQPSHLNGFQRTSRIAPFHENGGWRAVTSPPVTLAAAVFLGVFIPEALHPWVLRHFGNEGTEDIFGIEAAIIGSVLAIFVGHMYLNRFTSLPTIKAKTYVFPAMLIGFSLVSSILYLSSIQFGRYHFIVSFLITVPWYIFCATLRARRTTTRVAIIGDNPHLITDLAPQIEWTVLSAPILTAEVSAIVVDTRSHLAPEWEHFIAQAVLEGIPVHDARYMIEVLTHRVDIKHMADNCFGSLLPALYYIRVKRLIDVAAAIPALVLAAPVIGFFGLLVRLESKGPMFFSQWRTGFRGRPFVCYKLRSMHDGHNGPRFTLERDSRVTRVGAFIRKYHIDELPQIFNVARGEMSWIGPRPEALELAQWYEEEIPYYVYRHAVYPGISGWAAVHQGNVAETDAAAIKLQFDFFYIKYCSLWLDILIAIKSVKTVLTGFGSR